MAQTKITLTPKIGKRELIIGIQAGEQGRLLSVNVPTLKKADQTVLTGEPTSSYFRAQVEKTLSDYVPRPHHVYSILKLLGRKEA